MIAYTSWHWIAATGAVMLAVFVAWVVFDIVVALAWAFIMRHRRREGGN